MSQALKAIVLENKTKVIEAIKGTVPLKARAVTKIWKGISGKEKLLMTWRKDQTQKCILLSTMTITAKAKSMFVMLHFQWRSPPAVFTDWLLQRNTFCQPCEGHWGFWDLLWIVCFMLLTLFCGRIIKFVCLLLILQCTRPSADSFPLAFLRANSSLAHRLRLAFCVCSLATWQNRFLPPCEPRRESIPGVGVCRG